MQRLGQEESNGWKRIMMALTKNLIPYHYKNNGQWLEHPHPTIMLSNSDGSGKWADTMQHLHHPTRLSDAFKAVRWSPPFQAPLPLETTNLPDIGWWLAGAKMLKHEFEHEEAVLRTKLSEGTCVIFDNWRVLHARKGFSGGERWLRGAYVGETEFQQCMLGLASESFR